jgi:ferredoxin-thioredoxin reductase catalytic subunit
MAYLYKYRTIGISYFLFVTRCSAWNGSRAFSKYLVRCILLVTSADESRRQIVVCPPVYAAGSAISPCGATSADESRRQIMVCPPVYAAGLAISPCGAIGIESI